MNLGIAKKKRDKNVFKLAFRFLAFPEIPKRLETSTHKKFNLQRNRKVKMSRIMVFSSG